MVRKKAVERPDPVPFTRSDLMMPQKLGEDIYHWRKQLKDHLVDRDRVCRSCGCAFKSIPHMHEGIFSRGKVEGWAKRCRILIYCPLNCILLCSDCNMSEHGKHPPDPADVWQQQCERYGDDTMLEWHDSLLFKQEPFFVTQTRKENDT